MTEHASTTERIARRQPLLAAMEWPTLSLIGGCYATWVAAGLLYVVAPLMSVALIAVTIVLHSSLQHEAVHRHPTPSAGWNEVLVGLPLGLLVPYRRYRQTHLEHHADSRLTDPYDDPESYYLAHSTWQRMPRALHAVLTWNNRLAVRMLIGPAIGAIVFLATDLKAALRPGPDGRQVRRAWGLHAIGLIAVLLIVRRVFAMPVGIYLLSTYLGLSILAVRSFCEHQWAERIEHRTVIVERSLLGLLFLNNNLHLVHHTRPGLPWYALPAAYRARRADWQRINDGYVFHGYRAVLRRFAFRAKEPVLHPAQSDR